MKLIWRMNLNSLLEKYFQEENFILLSSNSTSLYNQHKHSRNKLQKINPNIDFFSLRLNKLAS